jgi:DNA-nicking Smr family endonuclease
MRIQLGDRVRFVNESLEGTVTSIKGNQAGVTIEDDFEIPVPISDLVKIAASQTNAPDNIVSEKKITPSFHPSGVFIAFDRVDDDKLTLIVYNHYCHLLALTLIEEKKEDRKIIFADAISYGTQKTISTYSLAAFSSWPLFHIDFIALHTNQESKPSEHLSRTLRFHAKEFHASYKQCFFLQRQAYVFKLNKDTELDTELKKLTQKEYSLPGTQEVRHTNVTDEVDLHMDKLGKDLKGMNAADIVIAQMEHFEYMLLMAKQNGLKKVVFIHGVGNQYLKSKIEHYLSVHKNLGCKWQQADILKYGGGATEVVFQ